MKKTLILIGSILGIIASFITSIIYIYSSFLISLLVGATDSEGQLTVVLATALICLYLLFALVSLGLNIACVCSYNKASERFNKFIPTIITAIIFNTICAGILIGTIINQFNILLLILALIFLATAILYLLDLLKHKKFTKQIEKPQTEQASIDINN